VNTDTDRPTRLDATTGIEYRDEPAVGEERGTVVVLHGGHLRAGTPLGESGLATAGFRVIAPSRPGYGRTLPSVGPGPREFADVLAGLLDRIAPGPLCVLGISAGGPAAVALAETRQDHVARLVLVSARSPLPFPTGATRAVARVVFRPGVERVTWALTRGLLRLAPRLALTLLTGSLSSAPAREVLADLDPGERAELAGTFRSMRSGVGFRIDVEHPVDPDLGRALTRPTLVVASRRDGQVGWQHAVAWRDLIPAGTLWESPSASHLVWFGPGARTTQDRVIAFVTGSPPG